MKGIMNNWRRFLTEAELQYSKSAAQEVENLVRQNWKPGDQDEKVMDFQIPRSEVYYSNNPKITNGAVMYQVANVLGWDLEDPATQQKLSSRWDSNTKSFIPSLVEQIFESPINMPLYINAKDSTSQGSSGASLTKSGKLLFYLAINPSNMIGDKTSDVLDVLEDTVRHEMQHVTQKLNGLALNYGEQIATANGDFSKIKVAKSFDDIKKFGIGREQTGRSQQANKDKDLSQNEKVMNYLGDDFEYETWMSDLISQFIRWSLKVGWLSPTSIAWAKFLHDNDPGRAENDQDRKKIRQVYLQTIKNEKQKTGKSTQEVIEDFGNKKTFDELATDLVRQLVKGMDVSSQKPSEWKASDVLVGFGRDTDESNVNAFQILTKLRRKEFLGDFLDNLTQRLKQQ
jgi:hypothetical protein